MALLIQGTKIWSKFQTKSPLDFGLFLIERVKEVYCAFRFSSESVSRPFGLIYFLQTLQKMASGGEPPSVTLYITLHVRKAI